MSRGFGQLADDLLVGGAQVGIRLQPAGPALLMPAQVQAAGGVDRQLLVPSTGQDLGDLVM